MRARYEGVCARCSLLIHAGDPIAWDRHRKEAMHEKCGNEAAYDPAYDDNPEGRWAAIQRISQYAQARIERERAGA